MRDARPPHAACRRPAAPPDAFRAARRFGASPLPEAILRILRDPEWAPIGADLRRPDLALAVHFCGAPAPSPSLQLPKPPAFRTPVTRRCVGCRRTTPPLRRPGL